MLTVKYTGDTERTVGVKVVYPGELLSATPAMLASWRAEHGDLFAVAGETPGDTTEAGAIVMADGTAHVFATTEAGDKPARGRKR